MKWFINNLLIISMVMVSAFIGMQAKVRSIESTRDFEQRIDQKGLCVVLFYHNADKANGELRAKNKELKRMFEDLSARESYDEADVVFIRVNIGRKELSGLMEQYGVATVPSFMLFRNGRSLADKHGNSVLLKGFVPREKLESFIDTHCGKEIDKLNVAKHDAKKERIKEEKESWQPYFYPRDIFVKDYDPDQRNME